MLKEYVNYGGETVRLPVKMVVEFEKSIVQIEGIDQADCYEVFESKKDEFSKLEHDIEMYTPRLQDYYAQRREN